MPPLSTDPDYLHQAIHFLRLDRSTIGLRGERPQAGPHLFLGDCAGRLHRLPTGAQDGPLTRRRPLVVERPFYLDVIDPDLRHLAFGQRQPSVLDNSRTTRLWEQIWIFFHQPPI